MLSALDTLKNSSVFRGDLSHIRLAFLHGRIAVGIEDLGTLSESARDKPMDEAQQGNCAKGDADDGAGRK